MNKKVLAFLLIISLSLVLRLVFPLADLPPDISISGSIYTDEGNQCHNSRAKYLYDNWYPDDWRITHYNPIVPWFKLLIFKVFGCGLLQIRMVSQLFAFLTLIIFYFSLKNIFDYRFALVGTFIYGINFLMIMYSRIGTFETPMIFWLYLSIYLLTLYEKKSKGIFLTLSAMSGFMAFVFKNISIYFLPVPFTAILLYYIFTAKDLKKTKVFKPLSYLLAGLIFSFSLWLFLFYLPNREWIISAPGKYIGNQMVPKTISQAIGNLWAFNWKEEFYRLFVIWLLSIVSLPLFYRKLFRGKLNLGQIAFFLFFMAHTTFFFFMNHRPTRYLIPVIPTMIVMFLFLFYPREKSQNIGFKRELIYYPLDILSSFLFLYFAFIPFTMKMLKGHYRSVSLKYTIISSLLLPLLIYSVLYYKKFIGFIVERKGYILVWLLFTIAYCDFPQFFKWKKERTYTVYNIAKELDKKIIPHAFIAGLTAPVAVMESKHQSLFLFPKFVNYDRPYERYPLTHALLASFNREINMHFKDFPHIYKNSKLLNNYGVKDQFLHLYSLNSPYLNNLEFKDSIVSGQFISKNDCEKEIYYALLSDNILKLESLGKIKLSKGENSFSYPIPLSKGQLTLYLRDKEWKHKHRYEAEKFNRRVGKEIFNTNYSSKFYRYYNKYKMPSSYLSYGPFIIYNPGLMKVSFKLKFKDFKTKIKALAILDIYSDTDRKTLVKKEIRPKDINKDGIYNLYLPLKKQKVLEFRVFATKNSSIIFDYVDLNYYEGNVIEINKDL